MDVIAPSPPRLYGQAYTDKRSFVRDLRFAPTRRTPSHFLNLAIFTKYIKNITLKGLK